MRNRDSIVLGLGAQTTKKRKIVSIRSRCRCDGDVELQFCFPPCAVCVCICFSRAARATWFRAIRSKDTPSLSDHHQPLSLSRSLSVSLLHTHHRLSHSTRSIDRFECTIPCNSPTTKSTFSSSHQPSTDRAVGSPQNRSILGTVYSPQQYPYMRTVASFLSFRCFHQFASKSLGDPVLGLGERIRDYAGIRSRPREHVRLGSVIQIVIVTN